MGQPFHVVMGRKADGTNLPVSITDDGKLSVDANVSANITGVDGAIVGDDGVTQATVRDYTNSNPLAVVLTDTTGDAYVASAGGGGGAVTIADGDDAALGATTDVAVTGDNSGTASAKLRGLTKIFSDVWDSVNHYLKVQIQNSSIPVTDNSGSLTVDDGGGSITVDGTFWQATQPVSAASLPLPSGAATAAKQPALGTAGTASTDVITVQGIASMMALKVDGSAVTQPVSDAGGSLTVDGTVSATSAGDVAHDAADSGNPVKVGGKAVSSEPSTVSAGDRANLITDLVGKLITLPYANPENFVSGAITSAMTGTTSTSLVAAPGAGLRNYLTTIIVSNSHATVGTDIVIQDGSGGSTLLTIPAAAVYGGAVITLPTPLRQPTANTAIYCANVTTGASTKVSAVGYKGA